MQALIVTFDHLPLDCLGCYGNTWIETPNFDRLAAESVVFDACFAADLSQAAAGGGRHVAEPSKAAWWTGRYPRSSFRGESSPLGPWAGDGPATVIDALARAWVRTTLGVECPASGAAWPRFDKVHGVAGIDAASASGDEYPFAQLVSLGMECLVRDNRSSRSTLLWFKSRGVPSPWIPPREVAGMYWDEFFEPEGLVVALDAVAAGQFDAALLSGGIEPERSLADSVERLAASGLLTRGQIPETTAGVELNRAVYAAYVSALDSWLGRLLDAWRRTATEESLLVVAAAAGDLPAKHPQVRAGCPPLVDALVHVPLIVRRGRGAAIGTRRQSLVSLVDLAATLAEWFGVPEAAKSMDGRSLLPLVRGTAEVERDAVFLGAEGVGWGVRTTGFSCLFPAAREAVEALNGDDARGTAEFVGRPRLFLKPDDVWDMHDIADQYPSDVDALAKRLDEHALRCDPSPQPDVLHTMQARGAPCAEQPASQPG